MSWKIHALGATGQDVLGGVELPARVRVRVDEPSPCRAGSLLGSSRATPASRRIRAGDAVEGTADRPIDFILSCTLIGP